VTAEVLGTGTTGVGSAVWSVAVNSFFFGKNAALMSPIPTKNSSVTTPGQWRIRKRTGVRTGNDFDEVG
jgi:hypothetical protein